MFDHSPSTALALRLALWLFSGVGQQAAAQEEAPGVGRWWLTRPLSTWAALLHDLKPMLTHLRALYHLLGGN